MTKEVSRAFNQDLAADPSIIMKCNMMKSFSCRTIDMKVDLQIVMLEESK